jgi:hypothetical protein
MGEDEAVAEGIFWGVKEAAHSRFSGVVEVGRDAIFRNHMEK